MPVKSIEQLKAAILHTARANGQYLTPFPLKGFGKPTDQMHAALMQLVTEDLLIADVPTEVTGFRVWKPTGRTKPKKGER